MAARPATPRGRSAAPRATTSRAATSAERVRWRMSGEARWLVAVTAVLLVFGLAALYSASAIVAMQEGRDSSYYLVRQALGALAGIVVFAFAAKTDAERWRGWAWPLMGTALLLMLITVLPFTESLAPRIHGSRRFLRGSSLQPSELAKLAVVVWTSMLVIRKGDQMRRLTKGVLPALTVVGMLALFAALEPDLSAAVYFLLLMGVVMFAGGARIGHFVALGIIGTPLLWREMERLQYVLLRMTSFLDPGRGTAEVSYQLQQSLIAVGSGRLFGRGFGQGHQQYGYLPFPFSDFIGSNVGEEWGFIGIAALILGFAVWGALGMRIARHARSPFLRLVAVGLTFTVVSTAFIHLGVVLGLLPTTGLTLPFVSYGRSNLLLSLLSTGVLANIGSAKERVQTPAGTDPLGAVP
ncbi:MAG TPA: putative peptidoglycan glycosyltransferase FtsW [Gemmatimonadaceae bacterium]|nr:putative peptidoglycan glycosyltransferase FtsW [Gemmatimonadaceae bacterium]